MENKPQNELTDVYNLNDPAHSRRSVELLPEYLQTDKNKKFLSSTLDRLIEVPRIERIDAFVGSKLTPTYNPLVDQYLSSTTPLSKDYQLEPSLVVKDPGLNISTALTYDDLINQLAFNGAQVENHDSLFKSKTYSYNPHIDLDKFVNYNQYYWLPGGPDPIEITGPQTATISTYTVGDGDGGTIWTVSTDELTPDPILTLYRGMTYVFNVTSVHSFYIKTAVSYGKEDQYTLVVNNGVKTGQVIVTIDDSTPNTLYYVAGDDTRVLGKIVVKKLTENSTINVDADIVGKQTYKSGNGVEFTNGMVVYFSGQITPNTYQDKRFIVEGVGSKITLVDFSTLQNNINAANNLNTDFDVTPFDEYPFDDFSNAPITPEYITINKSSVDLNPWSRYNRWFHVGVIKAAAAANGVPFVVDQTARAKRPIIEFTPNIQLFNFGGMSKGTIDLIDTVTKNVFNQVEGTAGYYVDGVLLQEGNTVVFNADTDPLVRGKIYRVKIDIINNNQKISLIEETDRNPNTNDSIVAVNGNSYAGSSWYFDGTKWQFAQQKTSINQMPLFDLYDNNGNSYSDLTYHQGSFAGTKIFGYTNGTVYDSVLGINLKFLNVANIGDFLFTNYFNTESFVSTETGSNVVTPVSSGFLKISDGVNTSFSNVWVQNQEVQIPIIDFSVIETVTNNVQIVGVDNPGSLKDLTVTVFVNNIKKIAVTDYVLESQNTNIFVVFKNKLNLNDAVLLKLYTTALPSATGYYEPSLGLTNNPLNGPISELTLAEITDHLKTVTDRIPNFSGTTIGFNNLRDLGDYSSYGTRLVSHANPLSFAHFFIGQKQHDIVSAIRKVGDDYTSFKNAFLKKLSEVSNLLSPRDAVDTILSNLNLGKDGTFPYGFSDMLAYGKGFILRSYTVNDPSITTYSLNSIVDLTVVSERSVLIYRNGILLVRNQDYAFNTVDPSVTFGIMLAKGDLIEIRDFSSTVGSYIPPTPTKLGLYPKYTPQLYTDITFITPTNVIQGHDGSAMIAYGDYRDDIILELEKRIYNNLKVVYNPELVDINSILPGAYRTDRYSYNQIFDILAPDFLKWVGFNGVDYQANSTSLGEPRTFNYRASSYSRNPGQHIPGHWRGLFKYFYDTDRPDIAPWEMLGFSEEPSWWAAAYGKAPYTSGNLVMWQDLAKGIVRDGSNGGIPALPPNLQTGYVDPKYIRPDLLSILPVNEHGDLLDVVTIGLVKNLNLTQVDQPWEFGDLAPAEHAWRRSSSWPFAVQVMLALAEPADYCSLLFDTSRITKSQAGQYVYGANLQLLQLSNLVLYRDLDATGSRNLASGYQVILIEAGLNKSKNYLSQLKSDLSLTSYNLAYKAEGFLSKDKLQVVIDSVDPTSTNPGVLLPQEDYSIVLSTSNPIMSVSISGMIIQKNGGAWTVRGYDSYHPYFTILAPIHTLQDRAIVVGGVSENYVTWTEGKFYQTGQIAYFNNNYYRTTASHTATATFDTSKFQILASLPMVGGVSVAESQTYQTIPTRVTYGTVFYTAQQVFDLMMGYQAYLKSQGFIFDYLQPDFGEILDWEFSGKEFLFWTTQNWADGSLITLSPVAQQLKFSNTAGTGDQIYGVVDDVFNSFYEYNLLTTDGSAYPVNGFTLSRESNQFTLISLLPNTGFYFAQLNLVQKQHAIVFNNFSLFNDIIYDTETGYRQRRVKLTGFRTAEWDGGFTSPGFVYDEAMTYEWTAYTDYHPGDIVRYNGQYYGAINYTPGASAFDFTMFNLLPGKPSGQLLPNFEYKINQFEDFYSLDIDNFDVAQQKMAQHLTGYTPRIYLDNIFDDKVAQYKFYQGYIREKGTANAVNKLAKASLNNLQGVVDFKETWAFRVGDYGGFNAFSELEIGLSDTDFVQNPQIIKFVDYPVHANDLTYYVPTDSVLIKPQDYDYQNVFPNHIAGYSSNISKLPTAGYVRVDDIDATAININSILDIGNTSLIAEGTTFWLGFRADGQWDVLRYTRQLPIIIQSIIESPGVSLRFTTDKNHNFEVGDIVAIDRYIPEMNKVYQVIGIPSPTEFIVSSTLSAIPYTSKLYIGVIFTFVSVRFSSFDTLSDLPKLTTTLYGDKIWVDDDGTGKFAVYKKVDNYNPTTQVSGEPQSGQFYGFKSSQDSSTSTYAVSALYYNNINFGQGSVFLYDRNSINTVAATTVLSYFLNDASSTYYTSTIPPEFGFSLAYDSISDIIVAGAPAASHVRADASLTNGARFANGTNSSNSLDRTGVVKISAVDRENIADVTLAVLASPSPVSGGRFGHEILLSRSTSTKTLLVSAPGEGSGNVYEFKVSLGQYNTSTASVVAGNNVFTPSTYTTNSSTVTYTNYGTVYYGADPSILIFGATTATSLNLGASSLVFANPTTTFISELTALKGGETASWTDSGSFSAPVVSNTFNTAPATFTATVSATYNATSTIVSIPNNIIDPNWASGVISGVVSITTGSLIASATSSSSVTLYNTPVYKTASNTSGVGNRLTNIIKLNGTQTGQWLEGSYVFGPGIPVNTFVLSTASTSEIIISAPLTADLSDFIWQWPTPTDTLFKDAENTQVSLNTSSNVIIANGTQTGTWNIGDAIAGAGIPADTTVVDVVQTGSNYYITLSTYPTATADNVVVSQWPMVTNPITINWTSEIERTSYYDPTVNHIQIDIQQDDPQVTAKNLALSQLKNGDSVWINGSVLDSTGQTVTGSYSNTVTITGVKSTPFNEENKLPENLWRWTFTITQTFATKRTIDSFYTSFASGLTPSSSLSFNVTGKAFKLFNDKNYWVVPTDGQVSSSQHWISNYYSTTGTNLVINTPSQTVNVTFGNLLPPGSQFGYSMAGNRDLSIVAIGAPGYDNDTGLVQIYTATSGVYTGLQIIDMNTPGISDVVSNGDQLGSKITMSNDGTYLFISSPSTQYSFYQGIVSVWKWNGTRYDHLQNIFNPNKKLTAIFGHDINIDDSAQTLAITSLGTLEAQNITFDKYLGLLPDAQSRYGTKYVKDKSSSTSTNQTTFDGNSTRFYSSIYNAGSVSIFNRYNNYFSYAQELYTDLITTNSNFGYSVAQANDNIYVGAPTADSAQGTNNGELFVFEKIDKTINSWSLFRHEDPVVDVEKITKVLTINTQPDQIQDYLEIIDPVKGYIAGAAAQELTYKTMFDPAVYTLGPVGATVNQTSNWLDDHIGELWWDVGAVKYYWYEQGEAEYRRNNWGNIFPGSAIQVYEWVKSTYLPSEWAAIADTSAGLAQGISGQPKYADNSVLSAKQVYNSSTNSFSNVYYYWVRNKSTLPTTNKNRRISGLSVASLIADPLTQEVKHVNLLSPNAVALVNIKDTIKGNDINLRFNIDKIAEVAPKHTEWLLIQEGDEFSEPTDRLERKLIDSLTGHDSVGNPVPDPLLSSRQAYGVSVRPRQSMFVDRHAALKNLLQWVNGILISERITSTKNFTNLNSKEAIPDIDLNLYDLIVPDNYSLTQVITRGFAQAQLVCTIDTNGKISQVLVADSGNAYNPLHPPTVEVIGNGNGAIITTTCNERGQVISATIVNGGSRYTMIPTLQVRPYTVIVESDSEASYLWSKFEWNRQLQTWVRVHTQEYDTSRYWTKVDWMAPTYNNLQEAVTSVDTIYELATVTVSEGDYVRVKNNGDNRYLILSKTAPTATSGTFDADWNVVYEEKGTVQFNSTLWNVTNSQYSFDEIAAYDQTFFDQEPGVELSRILTAIKEDLFTDNLKLFWNRFFFKAVKFALTEQQNADWVFKTTYIDVTNQAGYLDQRPTYKLQNSSYYESWINEVKPYHTKIKNYKTAYTATDFSNSFSTDFDLPVNYNKSTQVFSPVALTDGLMSTYPYKAWADNYTCSVEEIDISYGGQNYIAPPRVKIITAPGDTGYGATAEAYLSIGSVYKIVITNSGVGYTQTPTVLLEGGLGLDGMAAKAFARISNNKVRSFDITLKFDRIAYNNSSYLLTNTTASDTFKANGENYIFKLTFVPAPDSNGIQVYANGSRLLNDTFTIEYYHEDYINTNGVTYNKRFAKLVMKYLPAINTVIKIDYHKDIEYFNAIDRINNFYKPLSGMPGTDPDQLMTGLSYGGVRVDTLPYTFAGAWDILPFYTDAWDSYASETNYGVVLAPQANFNAQITELTNEVSDLTSQLAFWQNRLQQLQADLDATSPNTLQPGMGGGTYTSNPAYQYLLTQYGQAASTITLTNNTITKTQAVLTKMTVTNLVPVVTPFSVTTGSLINVYLNGVRIDKSVSTTTQTIVGQGTTATAFIPLRLFDINTATTTLTGSYATGSYTVTNLSTTTNMKLGDQIFGSYIPNGTTIVSFSTATLTAQLSNPVVITTTTTITYGSNIVTFRDETSDGTVLPADPNALDTVISGGDLTQVTLGILPSDVLIDGSSYVGLDNSYGPEELLPGQIQESFAITVFEQKTTASPAIINTHYYIDPTANTYSIRGKIASTASILVSNNGKSLINGFDYTINTIANNITLASNTYTGWLNIAGLTVGGTSLVDAQLVKDTNTTATFVVSAASLTDIKDAYVTINGIETTNFVIGPPPGHELDKNSKGCVTVYHNATGSKEIQVWMFNQKHKAYSQLHEQIFQAINTTTTTFALAQPPGTALPHDTQIIVEFNGARLLPPQVSYYTVAEGVNAYAIDINDKYKPGQADYSRLAVYKNGQLLNPGRDYQLSPTSTDVVFSGGILTTGDALAIVSYVGNQYHIDTSGNLVLDGVARSRTDVMRVLTFANDLGPFNPNPGTSNSISTVPREGMFRKERFSGRKSMKFKMQRPIRNSNYVWVEYNGAVLTTDIDYSVDGDGLTVTVRPALYQSKSDKVVITSLNDDAYQHPTAYRMFTDILGRTSWKTLNANNATTLTVPLVTTSTNITVADASVLTVPNPAKNIPGIIYVAGERIEFFTITGNTLGQIRRGTLGTGVLDGLPTGTLVIDQGVTQNIPVIETTDIVRINITATTSIFTLTDLVLSSSAPYHDQVEIRYNGVQLLKPTTNTVIVTDTSVAWDSGETNSAGATSTSTLNSQFTMSSVIINSIAHPVVHLNFAPQPGSSITVTRRKGTAFEFTNAPTFISDRPGVLPSEAYYPGDPIIILETNTDLTDENGVPLEGI